MEIYLVGGAVRDEVLGRPVKDKDYVVIGGDEAALRRRLPGVKCVGRRHKVYLHRGAEYTLSEAEAIETDLLGRDLTINALAKGPDGELIGAPDAFEDLQNRVLRPVAEENFFQDPLRVVRAARFSALLPDFRIDDSLRRAMRAVAAAGRLAEVSAERVGNEVRAALAAPQPANFLHLLFETQALDPWFAEWQQADQIPAGPPAVHQDSVLVHTLRVMDRLAGAPLAVWMGFCHDIGKTATAPERLPSHHGHEHVGEHLARNLGHRLRLPQRFIRAGAAAARWHMIAGRYEELRAGTRVDLLVRLNGLSLVPEMMALTAADKPGLDVARMGADLKAILAVRLPPREMGQGASSGKRLRQRRCQALGRRSASRRE
ncbi:MAG: HD domain-containing protein [Desulfosarcinaceae bacterium]